MVRKNRGRKWTEDQRSNFAAAMARRRFDKRLKQNQEMKAELRTLDVSAWNNEQRPAHIYIQEAGRLRRYELRSLEVYVPEDTSL